MLALAALALSWVDETPTGWVRHSARVDPAEAVYFSVCLKESNLAELRQTALEVSTPGHVRYGRFLSVEEIERLTRPAASDMAVVTKWLASHRGVSFTRDRECLHVSTSVGKAEHLLSTSFHRYHREVDGRLKLRAGAYTLPMDVASRVSAIFGLHGVPLPPRPTLKLDPPGQPVAVTPTVLAQTYNVGSPTVSRGEKNRQAVAEFQGQYMNATDLATFFKQEVPTAQAGDEVVEKFVGVPYKAGSGVEAALDIQFIMGVAPGIKTEFWEWPDMDFCGDLANFTSQLLTPGGPLVMSISYGWQGNLSRIGCHEADVMKVDDNWAKLAAAGVSVFISSGDSGSACTSSDCDEAQYKKGQTVVGEVLHSQNANLDTCCGTASRSGGKGFTWTPPPSRDATPLVEERAYTSSASALLVDNDGHDVSPSPPISFDSYMMHVEFTMKMADFPQRDIHLLTGVLPPSGGSVKVHNVNGTFLDTTITFGPAPATKGPMVNRNVTMTIKHADGKGAADTYKGRSTFIAIRGEPPMLEDILWDGSSRSFAAVIRHGPNPPPPPPMGNCTIYSRVDHLEPAEGAVSGGPSISPEKVTLFPSWPASSPWVTAVGATRFLNNTIGSGEMASDQFGSGGGFSSMWNASQATWQQDAVAKYVALGPSLPKWPPAGSFPPMGRATPDVSALGEGYQVWEQGKVQSVGGTSASSPAFAGFVSLINEARFKAGKPQMGFMNPFLYKNADAFNDVTAGTNAIGRGTGPLEYGFAAAPGWDAATGLGSPDVGKLLAAALKD